MGADFKEKAPHGNARLIDQPLLVNDDLLVE